MDFVETYDDYPVISLMQLEDLGFFDKGGGADFIASHDLTCGGSFHIIPAEGSYRSVRQVPLVVFWVLLRQ